MCAIIGECSRWSVVVAGFFFFFFVAIPPEGCTPAAEERERVGVSYAMRGRMFALSRKPVNRC